MRGSGVRQGSLAVIRGASLDTSCLIYLMEGSGAVRELYRSRVSPEHEALYQPAIDEIVFEKGPLKTRP